MAGAVFLGALSTGEGITAETIGAAAVAAGIVALAQFRTYWAKEEPEYCDKPNKTLGSFII